MAESEDENDTALSSPSFHLSLLLLDILKSFLHVSVHSPQKLETGERQNRWDRERSLCCEGMNAYSSQHQEHSRGRNESDFFHEFMHDEAGKLYSFLSFANEHGQTLSLSLESMSRHSYKKQHALANTVSSSSMADGDTMGDSSCSCVVHARHECLKCGGDGASSGCTSRSYDENNGAMISILNYVQNSRYLKPAQQLLDEAVCVCKTSENELFLDKRMQGLDATDMLNGGRSQFLVQEMNWMKENGRFVHLRKENQGVDIKMAKLFALLEELERHQQQYFKQMHALVTSFEVIAGSGAAVAYTTLTMNAMLKHFCNLKDSITSHINSSSKALYKDLSRNHGVASLHRLNQSNKQKRDGLQCLGMVDVRQAFRPLRGLPEESVAALRAWLFEHFLHPYPSDSEKLMLSSRTGLTRKQISNWFINARVRLWKPMIEQMYREEFADD